MKYKSFLASVATIAFAFSIQPVQAVTPSDIGTIVDIVDESTNDYIENYQLLDFGSGNIGSIYIENNLYKIKTSFDSGKTWSEAFDLTNATDPFRSPIFEVLNNTQFIMLWSEGWNTYDDYLSAVFTVSPTGITKSDTVTVYVNDNINRQILMYSQGYVIVGDGAIYLYLGIMDYMDYSNPNSVWEFTSLDNGATWTKTAEVMTTATNMQGSVANAKYMGDGKRVVLMTGRTYAQNDARTLLRYFDGTSWQTLLEDPAENYRTYFVEPTKNGAGLVVVGYNNAGIFDVATYVWTDMTSAPLVTLKHNEAYAEVYAVSSDGDSRIAMTYVDKANGQNFYGARSVETEISTDAGVTWTNVVHDTVDDAIPAQDMRLYGSFVLVGDNNQIITSYAYNTATMDGFTVKFVTSNDNGQTWSEPVVVIDGMVNDNWSEQFTWSKGGDAYYSFTKAFDLANNYYSVPAIITIKGAPALPEKTTYKQQFKYKKFSMWSTEKAALREWANLFPDGTDFVVTAPNYTKVNQKVAAARSLTRANAVAKVLRNCGLDVTVVKGRLVKKLHPSAGRQVIARLATK